MEKDDYLMDGGVCFSVFSVFRVTPFYLDGEFGLKNDTIFTAINDFFIKFRYSSFLGASA